MIASSHHVVHLELQLSHNYCADLLTKDKG